MADSTSLMQNTEDDFDDGYDYSDNISVDVHTNAQVESGTTTSDFDSEFKSFPSMTGSLDEGALGSIEDTSMSDKLLPNDDLDGDLLPTPTPSSSSSRMFGATCLSLDFYKPYFNVDTEQVVFRIKSSFWPYKNTFLRSIEGKGDLYGPFWVATTLIFVIALAGNIVDYNNSFKKGEQDAWHYDFDKVSLAATLIYGYVSLVPFGLWAAMKWRLKGPPLLLDVFTLYGYSLFVFIPVSFVCIFPWIGQEIAWTSIIFAMSVSGYVLLKNIHATLITNNGWAQISTLLMGVAIVHIGLTLLLKFYFFTHVHSSTMVRPVEVNTTSPPD
eukprot:m.160091 g.160091  ORF g.160091 m.160091 type:complete len:327 (-) comp31170_c1_seq10:442-1422(-)